MQYQNDFHRMFASKNFAKDHFAQRWEEIRPKLAEKIVKELNLPKHSDKRSLLGILQNPEARKGKRNIIIFNYLGR